MEALQIVLPGHVVASAMRAKVDIVLYRGSAAYTTGQSEDLDLLT